MILDNILHAEKYNSLHPLFKRVFEYLFSNDFTKIDDGVYTLVENELFVTISHENLRSKEVAFLESHKEFIDVQFLLSGEEQFGFSSINNCRIARGVYDDSRDISFWDDTPQNYVTLSPGKFVVFYPDDAHAPLIGDGSVRKIVIKIRLA